MYIYISVVVWNATLAQWISSLDTFFITDEELIMKLYCQYFEIKSYRVFSEHAQLVHIFEDSEFTDYSSNKTEDTATSWEEEVVFT